MKKTNPHAQSAIESPSQFALRAKGTHLRLAQIAPATARRLPAQSAMEFLMTYGWAILVIIIVIAVLFYMGILNPRNVQPNVCTFGPGVSCYTFKISNGTGALILDFGQALGKSILITNISCSQNSTAPLLPLAQNITVPPGEHRWVLGGNTPNGINCTDEAGNPLDSAQLGERYKGKICIAYTELDTQTNRISCGDVSGNFDTLSAGEIGGGGESVSTPTSTPTPAPTPTGEPIPSCPMLIDSPGYYQLDTDLNSTSGDCITISASNVTLNCLGHRIDSLSYDSYGIHLLYTDHVTVKNCQVSDFDFGIYVTASNDNSVENNEVYYNNYVGIILDSSSGNNLTNNNVYENYESGIHLDSSTGNSLAGNTVNENYGHGIDLTASSNNNIQGNTAAGNSDSDFYCESSATNTDGGSNICYAQTGCSPADGGWLSSCPAAAPGCALSITSCCDINSPGLYALAQNLSSSYGSCIKITPSAGGASLDCSGNSIQGTTAPSSKGIELLNVNGATVRNCDVRSFEHGIHLENATGSIITGNNASSNTYAIYVLASGNTVSDSRFISNGIGTYISGSGNTISGNTIVSNSQGISMALGSNSNVIMGNAINSSTIGVGVLGTGNTIQGNSLNSNQYAAVELSGATNTIVTGNVMNSNYFAVHGQPSVNNTITNNDINGSGIAYTGIELTSCSGNLISGNNITQSMYYGVRLWNCVNNGVTNNLLTRCMDAISLIGASTNNITGNTAYSNRGAIFMVDSSNNNSIRNNNFTSNQDAIHMRSSTGNNFTGNTGSAGTWYGFWLESANGNYFAGNTATGNGQGDFYCDSSPTNTDNNGNVCTNKDGCGWLTCH